MNAWVIKRRQQKRQVSAIFVLLILFLLNNVSLGIINSSFLASYQQDGDNVSSLAYPLLGNTTTQMESVDRTSPGSILKTVESAQGGGQAPPTIFIYTIDTSVHGTYIYDTEFKQLLESLGFSVIIEDKNSISLLKSSCFTNVSQFWLMNGDTGAPLEVSEVPLILDAWRNGTDIVLAGRNIVSGVNGISENFGVQFLGNVNTEVNHSLIFANHPIWINITSLYTVSPLPSLIIDPTSQAVNLSFLPAMWTLHALFENETGKVFWESSCLHFKDDFIGFADNAQYISNLARYLQEPEITLLGAENNSLISNTSQISLTIEVIFRQWTPYLCATEYDREGVFRGLVIDITNIHKQILAIMPYISATGYDKAVMCYCEPDGHIEGRLDIIKDATVPATATDREYDELIRAMN